VVGGGLELVRASVGTVQFCGRRNLSFANLVTIVTLACLGEKVRFSPLV